MAATSVNKKPAAAKKRKSTNAQSKVTAASPSKNSSASNSSSRPVAAARTPVQQLMQQCAQQANRTRGVTQQEWFALGSYIAQFSLASQPQQAAATNEEQPGTMAMARAAGAGA